MRGAPVRLALLRPARAEKDALRASWCLMSNHYHLALRMGEVARGLEKYVETASRLVSRAAARRLEEQDFRAMVKAVDAAVIDQYRGA